MNSPLHEHPEDKAAVRKRVRRWRAGLSEAQVQTGSEKIMQRLLALPVAAAARSWFIYVAQSNEVQTLPLIEHLLRAGAVVSVPVVSADGGMLAQRIDGVEDLLPGKWGILAPTFDSRRVLEGGPALSIVPSVAVTRDGRRLGRGGGYYDRFLTQHAGTCAIALVFDAQLLASVPCEDHDRTVDWIVTESQFICCRA